MFEPKSFIGSALVVRLLIHFEVGFCLCVFSMSEVKVHIYSVVGGCPVSPVPFVAQTVPSPLNVLGTFVKDEQPFEYPV